MKKFWKVAVVPMATLLLLTGCTQDESRSVAEIGDEVVTEAELNEMLQKQHGTTMLDTLISYKIVDLEAKKAGVEVSEQEIDAEYERYANEYGGVEGMLQMLEQYNMSEEDIRDDLRNYLLTFKLLSTEIELTDAELEAFFNDNMEYFTEAASITASHILVDDEGLANELIARINDGEDFTALAKEYSIEDGAVDTGGSLGTFSRGEMVAEFEEAAFAMEVGQVSAEPVETEFGYHIILVEDKIAGGDADFDSNKEEVRNMLLEEKIDEMYTSWLEQKYEEYDVKRTLFE